MRVRTIKQFYYEPDKCNYHPGMVLDKTPEVAKEWLDKGWVMQEGSVEPKEIKEDAPKPKPDKVPDGYYWCGKCEQLHREDSGVGKRHLKHKV